MQIRFSTGRGKIVFLLILVIVAIVVFSAIWQIGLKSRLAKPTKETQKNAGSGAKTERLIAGTQPVIIRKKLIPGFEKASEKAGESQPSLVKKKIILAEPLVSVDPVKKIPGQTDTQIKTDVQVESDIEEKRKIQVEGDIPEKSDSVSSPKTIPPTDQILAKESERTETKKDDSSKSAPLVLQPERLEKASLYPYSIMLASCRLPKSAEEIRLHYQKRGLSPYIVRVELGKNEIWRRILVGHYKTKAEALGAKNKYKLLESIVIKTPYTNLIGRFSSQSEALDRSQRLKELGYSPYVLKAAEKSYRLVVGAFITRKGAEIQHIELNSIGIQNQIIKR